MSTMHTGAHRQREISNGCGCGIVPFLPSYNGPRCIPDELRDFSADNQTKHSGERVGATPLEDRRHDLALQSLNEDADSLARLRMPLGPGAVNCPFCLVPGPPPEAPVVQHRYTTAVRCGGTMEPHDVEACHLTDVRFRVRHQPLSDRGQCLLDLLQTGLGPSVVYRGWHCDNQAPKAPAPASPSSDFASVTARLASGA